MIDWSKTRKFMASRILFCTVATWEEHGGLRLFPIGSLRLGEEGAATYFEIFAKPVTSGAGVLFLGVDLSPRFWLTSLIKGRFAHPPAVRLHGTLGEHRPATEDERQRWFRRMKWFLKTPGGRSLWSDPRRVREVQFHHAEGVRVGAMTRDIANWLER